MLNEEGVIERCLHSIAREALEQDEIIVVDNGSHDRSKEIVLRFKNVKVLELKQKTIAALRNYGAACATGDILGFIDADCLISKGWRLHVCKNLSNANIAATGSRCNLPQDSNWLQRAWVAQKARQPRLTTYLNSGNLAVKSAIFRKVQGFNENMPTDEDTDLCLRINTCGNAILEDPAVEAVHLGYPQTVREFYKRENWHAQGMGRTVTTAKLDKPFIMTAFLGLNIVILVSLALFYRAHFTTNQLLAVSLILITLVPVITAIYRSIEFRTVRYFPSLVLLYLVYYVARLHCMTRQVINHPRKIF